MYRSECSYREVSGQQRRAVSKENYTLNGEEAGKDVDDNIPGIQETESETETQTQEAAVSDNGDGVFMMIILTIILTIRSSITITARMDIITMKNIESSRYLQWKWEMYLT